MNLTLDVVSDILFAAETLAFILMPDVQHSVLQFFAHSFWPSVLSAHQINQRQFATVESSLGHIFYSCDRMPRV